MTPNGMDLTQLLGEVIAPPAVAEGPLIWPPAIGWWILLVGIIACLVLTTIWFKKTKKKKAEFAYLNSALSKIATPDSSSSHEEQLEFTKALNRALKAIALEKFGHQKVASLSGDAWLAFLDETGKCNHFTQGSGQVFGKGMYQKHVADLPPPDHLKDICNAWCKEVCQ